MKKLLIGIIVIMMALSPIYAVSGFVITFGEATNANSAYKNSVLNYFQSHTDKNITNATNKVVTASEVNLISQNISGVTYQPNQIVSCAMVDLSYNPGIKIVVDTSKITLVTPKMYENALKSTGISNGYVVVTSPISATGESALAGVLKSYEIAAGSSIPDDAKKAATEVIFTQSQITNQTGQSPDTIATLFEKAQNEVQSKNLQDPAQIKIIVINVANSMNINLTDQQAQQIATALADAQKAQGSLDSFKNSLQSATQQASQSSGIINQILSYLQSLFDYLKSLFGQ
ncbi:MAG: hypothetical protein A4E27_00407 [Methanobacterium sp. PtaU1.Bin242]|nr:MAG: hypothetical protein A4E27_00407 [Methanobacterium sp. PtaU1.Bin242]